MNDLEIYPRLLKFIKRLEQNKIFYTLSCDRDEAIMINISVPGEHWEVEFLLEGSVDVEIFKSDGTMHDESSFDRLFAKFSN